MTEEGRPTLFVLTYTVIKQSKLVGGEGLRMRLLKSQPHLFGEHIFTVLEQHYCNSTLVHMLEATVEWVNAYHAAVPVSPCTVGE